MSECCDDDLMEIVTKALQAQERLFLELKKYGTKFGSEIMQKSKDALLSVRDIKANVEGSQQNFKPMTVNRSSLQELRPLMLMHIPSSITEEVRRKFGFLLSKAFFGECKKLLFATLLTCPWYQASQRERGEQARHNVIFAIFVSKDRQFLAPVNMHIREETDVIDAGCLYANEVYHFSHFLVKGKTRCVEALFCPEEAILYEDPQLRELRKLLYDKKITGLKGFLEACRGQSVGGIGKKGKDGRFRMKDTTTFHELCSSFRLMHHAYNAANHLLPSTEDLDVTNLPDIAQEAAYRLKSHYENPDISKKDIFDLLVAWKNQTDEQLKGFVYTNPKEVESIVGTWLMKTRLERTIINELTYEAADDSNLQQLMERIGGPVSSLHPSQILLIAKAGSHMYGLATTDSDTDYVVIYADKTKKILSSCNKMTESFESRGPTKDFELGAYEARLFCEMLLKGSVVIVELLFADSHEYTSPAWKKLALRKKSFLTEKILQQYLGLIRNNFDMIESEKHKETSRERKLFYQIFHKLDSLSYFLKRQTPPVLCQGQVKDFIMKIRRGPLEGDIAREQLYSVAKEKFETFLKNMAFREWRFMENVDYNFVTGWLLSVRGI